MSYSTCILTSAFFLTLCFPTKIQSKEGVTQTFFEGASWFYQWNYSGFRGSDSKGVFKIKLGKAKISTVDLNKIADMVFYPLELSGSFEKYGWNFTPAWKYVSQYGGRMYGSFDGKEAFLLLGYSASKKEYASQGFFQVYYLPAYSNGSDVYPTFHYTLVGESNCMDYSDVIDPSTGLSKICNTSTPLSYGSTDEAIREDGVYSYSLKRRTSVNSSIFDEQIDIHQDSSDFSGIKYLFEKSYESNIVSDGGIYFLTSNKGLFISYDTAATFSQVPTPVVTSGEITKLFLIEGRALSSGKLPMSNHFSFIQSGRPIFVKVIKAADSKITIIIDFIDRLVFDATEIKSSPYGNGGILVVRSNNSEILYEYNASTRSYENKSTSVYFNKFGQKNQKWSFENSSYTIAGRKILIQSHSVGVKHYHNPSKVTK